MNRNPEMKPMTTEISDSNRSAPTRSPRRLDLVSIGECLVEFNRTESGAWAPSYAGDAYNALFYAGRLGLATGFISAVGDDLFTPMMAGGIERDGIDTSRLLHLQGRRNGLYFIELDRQGEYTFHFWRNDSAATETLLRHDPEELKRYVSGSSWLLLSGITLAVMKGRERLLELLRAVRGTTRIAFDTNYRARLWTSPQEYRTALEEVLGLVDLYLPSRSDLHVVYPGSSIEEHCRRASEKGVGTIVVKSGADGFGVWHGDRIEMFHPPSHISVVDTTGAGDAFNGGLIAGLTRGLETTEAGRIGQRAAEHALRVHGAIDRRFEDERTN